MQEPKQDTPPIKHSSAGCSNGLPGGVSSDLGSGQHADAMLLIAQKRFSQAVPILQKAIELGCNSWEVQWDLAKAAKEAKLVAIVDEACKNVQALNPNFWFAAELPKHVRGYYSQCEQDRFIEDYFRRNPPSSRFFIEVGAFDGVHFSNVRRMHESYGWDGICIEPIAGNFAKLKASYANTSVKCIKSAVGIREGESEINVATYPHLPDWGSDISTNDKNEMKRWNHLGVVWTPERVQVRTLANVFFENGVSEVDLLSVDVEGSDLEVLYSLDFSKLRPILIVVEYYGSDRQLFNDFLTPWGYKAVHDNGQDLFFSLEDPNSTPSILLWNDRWPMHNQEALLMQLENRYVSQMIETLYVIGAHHFQEKGLLDRVFPNIKNIILFEPLPDKVLQLQELADKDRRIRVFPFAISSCDGEGDFHVTSNDGASSSLLPLGSHSVLFPEVSVSQTIRVATRSIDSVISEFGVPVPDMVFLDVQGSEYDVLSSMSRSVFASTRLIYTEASTEEVYQGSRSLDSVRSLLEGSSFTFLGYAPLNEKIRCHGNALFVNNAWLVQAIAPPREKRTMNEVVPMTRDPNIETILGDFRDSSLKHEWERASDILQDGLARFPENAELLAAAGKLCLSLGDPCSASALFARVIKIDANNVMAHLGQAEVDFRTGKHEKSKKGVLKVLESQPDNIDALKLLASISLNSRRYDEALQILRSIMRRCPTDHEVQIQVAECCMLTGDHDTARTLLDALASECPRNTVVNELLGQLKQPNAQPTPEAKENVNKQFIDISRSFWNASTMYEAMFDRIVVDPKQKDWPLEQKIAAWNASAQSSLSRILSGLPMKPEWRALEIGCGVGRIVKPFRELIAQVDGVDISDNMIDFSREYMVDAKTNGTLYVNNGFELDKSPSSSYDLVYSMIVFQHIRSVSVVRSYLKETLRVLKPGGFFRLQVQDTSNPTMGHYLEEGVDGEKCTLSGNGYTPRQLESLLSEGGFEIASVNVEGKWIWATARRPRNASGPLSPEIAYVNPERQADKVSQSTRTDLLPKDERKHAVSALAAPGISTFDIVTWAGKHAKWRRAIAETKDRLDRLRDAHYGKRCVIIGNGPSLRTVNWALLKNEFTFGLNRIYLLFDKMGFVPSFYACINPLVIEQSIESIYQIPSQKFLSARHLRFVDNPQGIAFLNCVYEKGFSTDITQKVPEGYTVTYVALQLAYHMGFGEVILIGVDHSYKAEGAPNSEVTSKGADQNHFHPDYFGKGFRWHLPDLANSEISFRTAKGVFEDRGRVILDATVDGKLTVFPKVQLETALGSATALQKKANPVPRNTAVHLSHANPKILVSAIVSTYNSEKYLRECLSDLENQTIADKLEIVVVNSGSRQKEDAIVKEFQTRYSNIRYLRTENRESVYQAWNRGVLLAEGKYITNANTDDRHFPQAFEEQVKALEDNPACVLAYYDQKYFQEQNGIRVHKFDRTRPPFSFRALLDDCFVGSQPMWRRSVHEELGLFDEAFFSAGDYEFWLRIGQKYPFIHISDFLGERLLRNDSIEYDGNGSCSHFEAAIIRKAYTFALNPSIQIDDRGISSNPVFADWCEVHLLKRRTLNALSASVKVSDIDRVQEWRNRQDTPVVSIVIVTFNRTEDLMENLRRLNAQTEKAFEVIVVNNGPEVDAFATAPGFVDYSLCYIKLKGNCGPSLARNIGAQNSKGKYIAFLDDDAIADDDWVRAIVTGFSTYAALGIRGNVLPKSQETVQHVPPNYELGEEVFYTAANIEMNCAFRKDIFSQVCGFDEHLFGFEGVELSFRIFKATAKLDSILYLPSMIIHHDFPGNPTHLCEVQLRNKAMKYMCDKKDSAFSDYVKFMWSLLPRNRRPNEVSWFTSAIDFCAKNAPDYMWGFLNSALNTWPMNYSLHELLVRIFDTMHYKKKAILALEISLDLLDLQTEDIALRGKINDLKLTLKEKVEKEQVIPCPSC